MRLSNLSSNLPVPLWRQLPRWLGGSGLREFFAYHGVWALGVRLLRRLRIRDKILLVLALVALPMVPMAVHLMRAHAVAVAEAEIHAQGSRLVTAGHELADQLRLWEHETALGKTPDPQSLERARQALEQTRQTMSDPRLVKLTAWESVHPALARLRQLPALSAQAQAEALAQAHASVDRLHEAVVDASGFILTSARDVQAHAQAAYVLLPEAAREMSQVMRALRLHVAVQDRPQGEAQRLSPTLLVLAGRIERLDLQLARLRATLAGPELNATHTLLEREIKQSRALVSLLRASLIHDGYVNAEELAQIRSSEALAHRELEGMLEAQTRWLNQRYAEQGRQAHIERSVLIGGTALSLSLALYLFYAFYLVMRGGLQSLNGQMLSMSKGDLSRRPGPLGGDEVAETMRAVSLSVERLAELLAAVRHGSTSVSQAAQQIASGNGDLRSRNHRTSESLVRVVDGVARYSAQLEASAQLVDRVVGTVQALRLQSTRSRRQMERLCGTLSGVRAQSQQVQDAVSLIDNIAFRTNILALNASVEASKAGESGRGFAVVAQEVRALALRSAEAARRIGNIVGASAGQVEQSAQLAEDTGRAIAESDGHIDGIHSAMADVSALTREGQQESNAILEQVRALRETTEKNLGLVEQLANASHSLRSHGERLTHRLANFKLG